MYEHYKDSVEFILVYIREAHPTDGWVHPANEREGIQLRSATTAGEKEAHAEMCVRKLDIAFTTVVDDLDYPVEAKYSGWPDRLYLVGRDGRIAWKGQPGPGGFQPKELEAAIAHELSPAQRDSSDSPRVCPQTEMSTL